MRRAINTRLAVIGGLTISSVACRHTSSGGLDPVPTLQVALERDQLSVPQDWKGTVGVTVTGSGGAAGPVSLALEGPAGVTGAFDQPAGRLTVTVGPAVAVGHYALTVRAQGSGASDGTASLGLDVTAPTPARLDLSRCSQQDWPVFAAYQDEPGMPWHVVETANGITDLAIRGTHPALAVATARNAGGHFAKAWYATAAELPAMLAAVPCSSTPAPLGKTLVATISNLPAGNLISLSLGRASTAGVGDGGYALSRVPDGVFDFVAYAWPYTTAPSAADRVVLRRDINTAPIPAGGAIGPAIDVTGPEAFGPTSATVSIDNLVAGEAYSSEVMLMTMNEVCARHQLYWDRRAATAGQFEAWGVPADLLRPTDRHEVSIFGTAEPGTSRRLTLYRPTLAPMTVSLPPYPPVPAVTPLQPAARPEFAFVYPTQPDDHVIINHSGSGSNRGRLEATRAYFASDTVRLAFPDLTGLAGWDNAWADGGSAPLWQVFVGNDLTGEAICTTTERRSVNRSNDLGGHAPVP